LVNNKKVIQCNIRDISERKLSENKLNELYKELKISKEIIQNSLYDKNILVQVLTESEAKLKESVAIKDKFFSIIAHDIKSPFSGFLGLTDLMAKEADQLSKEEIKNMSESLNKSANTVYNLIEDLLLWSRTQTDSMQFKPELLDLHEISRNIINSLKQTAFIKNIELLNHIESDCHITGDSNMIKTVFRNLISNSIKFTNEGGKIEIGTVIKPSEGSMVKPSEGLKPSEGYYEIYVKDNGIGISKIDIEKLFKVEEHFTSSGTKNEKGTGLGLILCKEFVEKHGGKIWVESEEEKGTTFFFTIPDISNAFSTLKSKVNLEKSIQRNKLKILIADDDPVSYEFLYNVLKKTDALILRAENGQQAVDIVCKYSDINLVLMDVQMPLMDGFIATKQIKKIRPDLPVIAQTAYDFSQGQSYILSVGFNDYLTKPIDINILNTLIEKYLG
jgi:signal transduction histidine kinase/CheY-like chemotaxis protein